MIYGFPGNFICVCNIYETSLPPYQDCYDIMAKTCDVALQEEDVTIGLTVGERLNSFKNSYVPGYVSMYLWMDIVLFAHNIVLELEGI